MISQLPPLSPDLACPPNRPSFMDTGIDVMNFDTYSRSLPPSPDLAFYPSRPYLMNTEIDLTKTVPLSAAADVSGSDEPAREFSQLRNENQTEPSYAETH